MGNHHNASKPVQIRPTLDYAPATRSAARWRPFLWYGCLTVALLLVVFLLLQPIYSYHPPRPRFKCAAQLRDIGNALILYASKNGHRFPDSLEGFVADPSNRFNTQLLCCPSTSATPAAGTSQSEIVAAFANGNHCSYVYLGRGMKHSNTPDRILIYEPLSNHRYGANVLFVDGHVEYLAMTKIQSLIQQNAAPTTTKNPTPSTQSHP